MQQPRVFLSFRRSSFICKCVCVCIGVFVMDFSVGVSRLMMPVCMFVCVCVHLCGLFNCSNLSILESLVMQSFLCYPSKIFIKVQLNSNRKMHFMGFLLYFQSKNFIILPYRLFCFPPLFSRLLFSIRFWPDENGHGCFLQ